MKDRYEEIHGEELSEEDRIFLTRYREQAVGGAFPDVEEISFLLSEAAAPGSPAAGAAAARDKLIGLLLPLVPDVALEFAGDGLPLADLVQEGNVGLMLALETLYGSGFMDPSEILPYLRGEARKAIESALSLNREEDETGEMIARRVNKLSDQIKELTEDLGGTPSIEEISVFLEMPVDEIEALIRLAGEGGDGADPDGDGT